MQVGFFGKLPAVGDFVRSGLPPNVIETLDRWASPELSAAQERFGDAFDGIWERAPHWHFTLGPGRLDATQAASGLWVPSIDRAGRYFPLIALVLHAPASRPGWMSGTMETLLGEAVTQDLPPDMLQQRLDASLDEAQEKATAARAITVAPPEEGWWRHTYGGARLIALRMPFPRREQFNELLQRRTEET